MGAVSSSGARRLHGAMARLLGTDRFALRLWDGVTRGAERPAFTLSLRSRHALGVVIGGLAERGFGRAYVAGELEIAPLEQFLESFATTSPLAMAAAWPRVVAAALSLGARPARGEPGDAEAHLRGLRHSRARDAAAVRHHYDLPPDFYRLFLDSTLTYSCAYFEREDDDLDTAQRAKLDLVCRKLRLRPNERLLDVGSGWGSLALHAAREHGVHALGITLSPRQLEVAQRTAAELGLQDRVQFQLRDYRDITHERFDAIATVGMIEHVGRNHLHEFSRALHGALRPGGRALVHGITCRPQTRLNRASFINTFVFPDGELEDVGRVVRELELAGFEVRDVESLREHYALTLQHWRRRLDQRWDEAVRIAGERRARVWRLYMTGSIVAFRLGSIAIHQTLAVRPTSTGASGVPPVRADWYRSDAVARRQAVPVGSSEPAPREPAPTH